MRLEMLAIFALFLGLWYAIAKAPDALMKVFLAAGWIVGIGAVLAAIFQAVT